MKNTLPPKDVLLDSERKEMFARITEYIGGIFSFMTTTAVPKWKNTEISRRYGIQNTHITEIKNYKKYRRELSKPELSSLIEGGLVTVKQLQESCARNEKERKYLDQFKIIEDKKLLRLYNAAKEKGLHPSDEFAAFLKEKYGISIDE